MPHEFEKVAETVETWAARSDMPTVSAAIAGTVCTMARRLATCRAPNLAREKALQVTACYLCRQAGQSVCGLPDAPIHVCPLGFMAHRV